MSKEVEELQKEVKVLKNEIKETLADVREFLLTHVENPFPVDTMAGRPAPARLPERVVYSVRAEPDERQPDHPVASSGTSGGAMPSNGQHQAGNLIRLAEMVGVPPIVTAAAPPAFATPVMPVGQPRGGEAPDNSNQNASAGSPCMPGKDQPGTATGSKTQPAPDEKTRLAPDERTRPAPGEKIRPATDEKTRPATDEKTRPATRNGYREQMAYEEVETEDSMPVSGRMARQQVNADLVSVAMLGSWAEEAIRKIGRERLITIVEIYESMGGLTGAMKEVLLRLISLDKSGAPASPAPMKDCLRVLVDLDTAIWRSQFDKSNAALVTIFQS
ncbi:MAG: hypothetical protein HYX90_01060 [Chloroflexi bacterium]|nr:hypothetical protein [Chloroflexota bacterium]